MSNNNQIRITRHPLTLALRFVGVTTNTEDPFGRRFTALSDPNGISVSNENMTVGSGVSIFTLRNVPYTNFLDADGNSFATDLDVVSYINNAASVGTQRYPESSVGLAVTVSSGVSFEYEARFDRASGYYWDDSTLPAGTSISSGDVRKLSGTISSTGVYNITLEVSNYFGITTSTVIVDVV